jgi:hypothetical protein
MTKSEIKNSGMFGYELVEEVVIDATLHQSSGEGLLGTLCRTNCGIRFIVEGGIYLAVENEEIDTVKCQSVAAMGCLPWRHLGSKALIFKGHESSRQISFVVPKSVANSWCDHFQVG